jgi:hypothetical protein
MCSPNPDGVFYEVITQRSIKEKASAPSKLSIDESAACQQQSVKEPSPSSAEKVLLLACKAATKAVILGPFTVKEHINIDISHKAGGTAKV